MNAYERAAEARKMDKAVRSAIDAILFRFIVNSKEPRKEMSPEENVARKMLGEAFDALGKNIAEMAVIKWNAYRLELNRDAGAEVVEIIGITLEDMIHPQWKGPSDDKAETPIVPLRGAE